MKGTGHSELLEDIKEYLVLQKDMGRTQIPKSERVIKAASLAPSTIQNEEPAMTQRKEPCEQTQASVSSEALERISKTIAECTKCPLHETRTNTVPGQGTPTPEIAFIGEGPGADEDEQGIAFIGRAGQLLTKIIEAMGLTRDEVWIGNIVKCRPPGNRVPGPEEMEACLPYLRDQLSLLKPKVIICLGATAVKGLLDTKTGITKLRGSWMSFDGIDVMPTFHPAYLLRNPPAKREVWEDMKSVLKHLDKPIPKQNKKD